MVSANTTQQPKGKLCSYAQSVANSEGQVKPRLAESLFSVSSPVAYFFFVWFGKLWFVKLRFGQLWFETL